MRLYRRYSMPKVTGHPLVRALYEEMYNQQVTDSDMCRRTGVCREALRNWRTKTNPKITDLEACFNAVGLTLKPTTMESVNAERD